MIGIFSRNLHPKGWGQEDGYAHGYVTLFVECADYDELGKVTNRLHAKDFYGLDTDQYSKGRLADWYGGKFDLVAITSGDVVPVPLFTDGSRFVSKGDNRFVGIYTAAEVLALR